MAKKSKTTEKSKNHNRTMKIKVVACRVFKPELELLLENSDGDVSVDYLPLRAHDNPDTLRIEIQSLIDKAESVGDDSIPDAVVLAYGLCGNATAGLRAGTIPLYIPQAHDCSQILLGGRKRHQEFFGDHPSRGWTSKGYLAEGGELFHTGEQAGSWEYQDLLTRYGEDNAKYVWDTLHGSDSIDDPVLYFLDIPETRDDAVLEAAERSAAAREKELILIPGTVDMIARLLTGRGGSEILKVLPGEVIQPSWDDSVVRTSNEQ